MPDDLHPIRDVSTLQRGDHLNIHRFGYPTYSGTVVATMPELKVVWIRATITEERKMPCADDYLFRPLEPPGIRS